MLFLSSRLSLPFHSSSSSSSSSSSFRPHPLYTFPNRTQRKRVRNGACRAEFSQDAPFAVAIGASILTSLVLPFPLPSASDEDGDSVIDSSDARFAVMGIISFIPYFNWLSWVFAWMDTGNRRYVVYALVYLVPYLRSNLSLSLEDSWLPIASILLCIIHIQLEASIQNGDIQGFRLFSEDAKDIKRNKDARISTERRRKGRKNLPSAEEQSRDKIEEWGVSKKPSQDPLPLNEDELDDGREH